MNARWIVALLVATGALLNPTIRATAEAGQYEGMDDIKVEDFECDDAWILRDWALGMYTGRFMGKPVPKDYARAAILLGKAAQLGDAKSVALLGSLYSLGHGVLQNSIEAHAHFNLAVSVMTDEEEREKVENLRDATAEGFTRADRRKAQERARELKSELEDGGCVLREDWRDWLKPEGVEDGARGKR